MNLSHYSSDADSSPSPNVEQPLYSPLTESDSETDFGSINDELDDDYGTSINAVDTTTTSGFIVYEKRKATGKPAISFELQTSSIDLMIGPRYMRISLWPVHLKHHWNRLKTSLLLCDGVSSNLTTINVTLRQFGVYLHVLQNGGKFLWILRFLNSPK